jgi:orotidine-5'-phosphate decarboxylase
LNGKEEDILFRKLENGADYIVVGRPISTAADPIAVVEWMQKEIIAALAP